MLHLSPTLEAFQSLKSDTPKRRPYTGFVPGRRIAKERRRQTHKPSWKILYLRIRQVTCMCGNYRVIDLLCPCN